MVKKRFSLDLYGLLQSRAREESFFPWFMLRVLGFTFTMQHELLKYETKNNRLPSPTYSNSERMPMKAVFMFYMVKFSSNLLVFLVDS